MSEYSTDDEEAKGQAAPEVIFIDRDDGVKKSASRALTADEENRISDHMSDFWKLIDMPESEYRESALYIKHKHRLRIHHVFHMPEELFFNDVRNGNTGMNCLRKALQGCPWVNRSGKDAVHYLRLKGKLRCRTCFQGNPRVGTGFCSAKWTSEHHESCHKGEKGNVVKEAEALLRYAESENLPLTTDTVVLRQATLTECGFRRADEECFESNARAVLSSMLVAGGDENGGVPPSNVPKVMNQTVVTLVHHCGGVSSAKTIRNTHLPQTVKLVEEEIKHLLKDKPVSFGIDCGNSNLFHGIKVMAVEITSPLIPFPIFAGSHFLLTHETGETQASFAEEIRVKYGIRKENIFYLGADNASVNSKAVSLLRSTHGWNIELSRCLPHCLNLVLQAFLDVWNNEYHLKGFLRTCRGLVKAGGAFSRKATLVEYGLSVSNIDFVDTRWTSLITGAKYLMERQSERNLKDANYLVGLRSKKGDKAAQAASAEKDVMRLRYDVLYEALEEIYDTLPAARCRRKRGEDLGDDTFDADSVMNYISYSKETRTFLSPQGAVTKAESTAQDLMAYLSNVHSFAGLTSLIIIMESVPKINQFMQRNLHTYSPGDLDLSQEVEKLISTMRIFTREDDLDMHLSEVEEKCLVHKQAVMEKEYRVGDASPEDILVGGGLDVAFRANLRLALDKLRATLKLCAAKVATCKGLEKLTESVECNARRSLFLGTSPFPRFPSASKAAEVLGMKREGETVITTAVAVALLSEIDRYRAMEKPPFTSVLQCATFWSTAKNVSSFPTLSKLAIRHLSRPPNNAGVERVFSILTNLDRPNRRSFKLKSLESVLFLRCNSQLVTKLGQVYAKRVDDPVLHIARNIASARPAQEERKRKDQRVYDECREEARMTVLAAGFQEEDDDDSASSSDDDDSASSSPRKKARMQSSNESGEAEWTD